MPPPDLEGTLTAVPSRSRRLIAVPLLLGALVGVVVGRTTLPWGYGVLAGWVVAVGVHLVWLWLLAWDLDSDATERAALHEDPVRALTDLVLLGAAVASLATVVLVLVDAQQHEGAGKAVRVIVGVATIVASWFLVHTLFTARYARTYFEDEPGGIDFNVPTPPVWTDFAYLAFTVGMTFQVSDTDLQAVPLRRLALRHMLLSYLFGAVIVAVTINTLAGLTQG